MLKTSYFEECMRENGIVSCCGWDVYVGFLFNPRNRIHVSHFREKSVAVYQTSHRPLL